MKFIYTIVLFLFTIQYNYNSIALRTDQWEKYNNIIGNFNKTISILHDSKQISIEEIPLIERRKLHYLITNFSYKHKPKYYFHKKTSRGKKRRFLWFDINMKEFLNQFGSENQHSSSFKTSILKKLHNEISYTLANISLEENSLVTQIKEYIPMTFLDEDGMYSEKKIKIIKDYDKNFSDEHPLYYIKKELSGKESKLNFKKIFIIQDLGISELYSFDIIYGELLEVLPSIVELKKEEQRTIIQLLNNIKNCLIVNSEEDIPQKFNELKSLLTRDHQFLIHFLDTFCDNNLQNIGECFFSSITVDKNNYRETGRAKCYTDHIILNKDNNKKINKLIDYLIQLVVEINNLTIDNTKKELLFMSSEEKESFWSKYSKRESLDDTFLLKEYILYSLDKEDYDIFFTLLSKKETIVKAFINDDLIIKYLKYIDKESSIIPQKNDSGYIKFIKIINQELSENTKLKALIKNQYHINSNTIINDIEEIFVILKGEETKEILKNFKIEYALSKIIKKMVIGKTSNRERKSILLDENQIFKEEYALIGEYIIADNKEQSKPSFNKLTLKGFLLPLCTKDESQNIEALWLPVFYNILIKNKKDYKYLKNYFNLLNHTEEIINIIEILPPELKDEFISFIVENDSEIIEDIFLAINDIDNINALLNQLDILHLNSLPLLNHYLDVAITKAIKNVIPLTYLIPDKVKKLFVDISIVIKCLFLKHNFISDEMKTLIAEFIIDNNKKNRPSIKEFIKTLKPEYKDGLFMGTERETQNLAWKELELKTALQEHIPVKIHENDRKLAKEKQMLYHIITSAIACLTDYDKNKNQKETLLSFVIRTFNKNKEFCFKYFLFDFLSNNNKNFHTQPFREWIDKYYRPLLPAKKENFIKTLLSIIKDETVKVNIICFLLLQKEYELINALLQEDFFLTINFFTVYFQEKDYFDSLYEIEYLKKYFDSLSSEEIKKLNTNALIMNFYFVKQSIKNNRGINSNDLKRLKIISPKLFILEAISILNIEAIIKHNICTQEQKKDLIGTILSTIKDQSIEKNIITWLLCQEEYKILSDLLQNCVLKIDFFINHFSSIEANLEKLYKIEYLKTYFDDLSLVNIKKLSNDQLKIYFSILVYDSIENNPSSNKRLREVFNIIAQKPLNLPNAILILLIKHIKNNLKDNKFLEEVLLAIDSIDVINEGLQSNIINSELFLNHYFKLAIEKTIKRDSELDILILPQCKEFDFDLLKCIECLFLIHDFIIPDKMKDSIVQFILNDKGERNTTSITKFITTLKPEYEKEDSIREKQILRVAITRTIECLEYKKRIMPEYEHEKLLDFVTRVFDEETTFWFEYLKEKENIIKNLFSCDDNFKNAIVNFFLTHKAYEMIKKLLHDSYLSNSIKKWYSKFEKEILDKNLLMYFPKEFLSKYLENAIQNAFEKNQPLNTLIHKTIKNIDNQIVMTCFFFRHTFIDDEMKSKITDFISDNNDASEIQIKEFITTLKPEYEKEDSIGEKQILRFVITSAIECLKEYTKRNMPEYEHETLLAFVTRKFDEEKRTHLKYSFFQWLSNNEGLESYNKDYCLIKHNEYDKFIQWIHRYYSTLKEEQTEQKEDFIKNLFSIINHTTPKIDIMTLLLKNNEYVIINNLLQNCVLKIDFFINHFSSIEANLEKLYKIEYLKDHFNKYSLEKINNKTLKNDELIMIFYVLLYSSINNNDSNNNQNLNYKKLQKIFNILIPYEFTPQAKAKSLKKIFIPENKSLIEDFLISLMEYIQNTKEDNEFLEEVFLRIPDLYTTHKILDKNIIIPSIRCLKNYFKLYYTRLEEGPNINEEFHKTIKDMKNSPFFIRAYFFENYPIDHILDENKKEQVIDFIFNNYNNQSYDESSLESYLNTLSLHRDADDNYYEFLKYIILESMLFLKNYNNKDYNTSDIWDAYKHTNQDEKYIKAWLPRKLNTLKTTYKSAWTNTTKELPIITSQQDLFNNKGHNESHRQEKAKWVKIEPKVEEQKVEEVELQQKQEEEKNQKTRKTLLISALVSLFLYITYKNDMFNILIDNIKPFLNHIYDECKRLTRV